ncbi:MAG: hypothetical protein ACYTAN_11415 [Planctomycetota bacterium]|jgi:hypothetical protein
MAGALVVLLILSAIGFVILLRLWLGGMDHGRIDRYIASRGGRILEKHWHPFGRGWLGEKESRIYAVRYVDADGNIHDATAKTSLLTGVYFTEDTVVARTAGASDDREKQRLLEENARLREELEQIRRPSD